MIKRVMKAPINLYYDVTPTGTIQNRFSKDHMGCFNIIETIGNLGMDFIRLFSIFGILLAADWVVIALIPVVLVISSMLFRYIMPAMLNTERVNSIVRSPVLNNLNECISGCSTIRAFTTQARFIDYQRELQHKEILCNEVLEGIWKWFHTRNNTIASSVMFLTCVGCLINRGQDPVILAIVITYVC